MNLDEILAKYDGTMPGGCDNCDAEQEMKNENGVWHLTIKHDDWCPMYASMKNKRRRS